MKHIISVALYAFAGATTGYVLNQILDMRSSPEGIKRDAVVVGAPPVTAVAAALVGAIFGRSRKGAFLTGAVLGAAFGDNLDRAMPPMSELKRKAQAMRPRPAGD
jgi:hypothetical protein